MYRHTVYSLANSVRNHKVTFGGGRVAQLLPISVPVPMKKPPRNKRQSSMPRPSNYNDCELVYNKKCIFYCIVICNIIIIVWTLLSYRHLPEYKIYNQDTFTFSKGSVKIKSCSIPKLEPFAEEILKFIDIPGGLNCPGLAVPGGEIAFHTNGSLLIQDIDSFKQCCYRPFRRESDATVNPENRCYDMKSHVTEISAEFIEIFCIENGPDYRDAFAFVHLKDSVEERLAYIDEMTTISKENRMSVIVLGMDATSHMNARRMLPKSLKYLTEEMDMISMNKYTKVAENTLPNIIPLLSGIHLNEFKASCIDSSWSSDEVRLDDCPFIWKTFSSKGYRTSFAEDDVNIGIFNMNWAYAFKDEPTDYYFRTFSHQIQKGGTQRPGRGEYCYGTRLSFKVLLDNIENTARTFRNKLFFQFTWATKLTHDDFNKLALGDLPLLSTLKYMKEDGLLNNTVLILMSDHGARIDKIRETEQGQMEDRMPFVFFVFPPWFSKKYPKAVENMKTNSEVVTSAFDVHQTLQDFMNLQRIQDENLAPENLHEKFKRRKLGTSLFRTLSENRGCSSTGIPAHWCLCHSKSTVSTSLQMVKEAVDFVVDSLNSLLKQYKYAYQCAQLTLDKITTAWEWNSQELQYEKFEEDTQKNPANNNDDANSKEVTILQVSFITLPGEGAFEATVLKHPEKNWILTEQVVRTNSYEGQGNCAEQHLKEYCYCTTKA